MFSTLRQGSQIFLLDKNGQSPIMKIGQVEQVTPPQPKYTTYTPGVTIGLPNMNDMVVNIRVKFEDGQREFNQVPANLTLADFQNGTIITDNRPDIISEIEVMIQNSKQILASQGYHQNVIQAGEIMLKQLNPGFAKEVARDQTISQLANKVDSLTENVNALVKLFSANKGIGT